MFRQLAKIASMPPSPKKRACSINAVLTAITAAQGPKTTAMRVPPTPCAVVPPGTGTLNIMTVKLSAEKIASSGTVRLSRTFLTRCVASPHTGTVGTARAMATAGARYPSGMCIVSVSLVSPDDTRRYCNNLRMLEVYANRSMRHSGAQKGPHRATSEAH